MIVRINAKEGPAFAITKYQPIPFNPLDQRVAVKQRRRASMMRSGGQIASFPNIFVGYCPSPAPEDPGHAQENKRWRER